MPSMKKIKKVETGIWKVEVKRKGKEKGVDIAYHIDISMPGNKNERARKLEPTLGEARTYKNYVLSQWRIDPEWKPQKAAKKDGRRLNALIDVWFDEYGAQLGDGKRRKKKLEIISETIDNPIAIKLDKKLFSQYRKKRTQQVSLKTVNNEHGYLCAMFNTLIELGDWDFKNPIADVRKFKLDDPELIYLEDEQIVTLLDEANKLDEEVALMIELCLSTGTRWSEAQTLKQHQVRWNTINLTKTKAKRNRIVSIDEDLYQRLKARGEGNLFRQSRCEKIFSMAISNASIELPRGQMTHVLRHTFASHFLANGGDILELRDILGHASIKTTEKYLKIIRARKTRAPELNPVAMLKQKARPPLAA